MPDLHFLKVFFFRQSHLNNCKDKYDNLQKGPLHSSKSQGQQMANKEQK